MCFLKCRQLHMLNTGDSGASQPSLVSLLSPSEPRLKSILVKTQGTFCNFKYNIIIRVVGDKRVILCNFNVCSTITSRTRWKRWHGNCPFCK